MPKLQKIKDSIDWIIRLQGAYAILATIVAGGVGTGVKALLAYYAHIPALWITPIWLFSAAIVLAALLILASVFWPSSDRPKFDLALTTVLWTYTAETNRTVFLYRSEDC